MKKGTNNQNSFLIGIVMMMIAIIVGILILNIFNNQMKVNIEEKKCSNSVIKHIETLKINKLAGKTDAPEINCPRIKYEIKSNDEKVIKYQLAEKMKTCWDNWQRGEEELFFKDASYCQPCYIVDFKHKDIEIKDFDKFLIETKIRENNESYAQYFSGNSNNPEFRDDMLKKNKEIEDKLTSFSTDTKKVILFFYEKDRDKIKELMQSIEYTGKGAIGGMAVGAAVGLGVCMLIPGVNIACGIVTAGAAIGGATGGFVGAKIADAKGFPLYLSYILIKEYDEKALSEIGCEIAPGKQTNIN